MRDVWAVSSQIANGLHTDNRTIDPYTFGRRVMDGRSTSAEVDPVPWIVPYDFAGESYESKVRLSVPCRACDVQKSSNHSLRYRTMAAIQRISALGSLAAAVFCGTHGAAFAAASSPERAPSLAQGATPSPMASPAKVVPSPTPANTTFSVTTSLLDARAFEGGGTMPIALSPAPSGSPLPTGRFSYSLTTAPLVFR